MAHRFGYILWALILAGGSTLAFSQEYSRADLFAGYSYLNVDTNGLSSRQSLNGWEASISGNFSRWLAAEADFSGHYKTLFGVNVSDYSYLAGPRVNFKPVFVHALVGGDHLRGAVSGDSASQDGLAAAFGGGLQMRVTRALSARVSGDYVLSRTIFSGARLRLRTISGPQSGSFIASAVLRRPHQLGPHPPESRSPLYRSRRLA